MPVRWRDLQRGREVSSRRRLRDRRNSAALTGDLGDQRVGRRRAQTNDRDPRRPRGVDTIVRRRVARVGGGLVANSNRVGMLRRDVREERHGVRGVRGNRNARDDGRLRRGRPDRVVATRRGSHRQNQNQHHHAGGHAITLVWITGGAARGPELHLGASSRRMPPPISSVLRGNRHCPAGLRRGMFGADDAPLHRPPAEPPTGFNS